MNSTFAAESKLVEAVHARHSVRSFQSKRLDERAVRSLRAEISYAITRSASIHFQLMLNDPNPFSGFRASYGLIRNAHDYIACVVDTGYDDCMEEAGYWAEMIALKAVSMGLGTCFVGGTYNAGKVKAQMRVTWRLPFLLLVGYADEKNTSMAARVASKFIHRGRKMDPSDFLTPDSVPIAEIQTRSPELIKGLEGIASAPSSMNRRPVRVRVSNDASGQLVAEALLVKDYKGVEIDLGIARANWEVCTGCCLAVSS